SDESESISGLGLLTMINDYQAQLGWKFETIQKDPEAIAVTTMVQLKV
ncbi:MAG: ATP-binding protein, partial [Cyanobacteriota bacterium]|nr:ATP-binding protein [Cyanobacteriota bacterium]